jgi:hypothetical protein
MIDTSSFLGFRMIGGFTIVRLDLIEGPLVDALGRRAVAKTQIIGREFRMTVLSRLDARESSVSLYHEILEAATVASARPPRSVVDFNEGGLEGAADDPHDRFGPVTPVNLNRMLPFCDFREE